VEVNSLRLINDKNWIADIFETLDVSEASRKDYQARIWHFLNFIKKEGLNSNSFLYYKRHLESRNDFSVSTKNKYLAVSRIFLKELVRRGYVPVDITLNIKSFQQSKKHKKEGISEDEMQVIAHSLVEESSTLELIRIKAIISLLALQGLRQIEVTRLDIADLELHRGVLFVHGKGRDYKEAVYLQPQTVEALKVYTRSHKIADGALFVSHSNNSLNKRISTRSVRQVVQDYLMELGIQKNVHGFRHYFTTRLIKIYKSDLTVVARYTRHRSLETLQAYNDAVIAEEDLPRFYGALSNVQL
jgi:integrase/recombinase XerC